MEFESCLGVLESVCGWSVESAKRIDEHEERIPRGSFRGEIIWKRKYGRLKFRKRRKKWIVD